MSGVTLNMDAASEQRRSASRYIESAAAGKDGEFTGINGGPLKAKPQGGGLPSHLGLLLNVTSAQMDQRPAPMRCDGASAQSLICTRRTSESWWGFYSFSLVLFSFCLTSQALDDLILSSVPKQHQ